MYVYICIYIYIYIYVYTCVYTYVYIYIYIERERERCIAMCIRIVNSGRAPGVALRAVGQAEERQPAPLDLAGV